jgi:hypothetical protein
MHQRIKSLAAFLVASGLVCSAGLGQTPPQPPDTVEEDWQVVIGSPNSLEVGPQITTCMSPVSDDSTAFVAFDLNYIDYPAFQAGGLQVKVCSGDNVLSSSSQGNALCDTAGETISWTQRMAVASDGTVTYSVKNGQSTTWGQFGTDQGLGAVTFSAPSVSLETYDPDTSVAESGAGWQSNRVTSMQLLRVRYYRNGQLVGTDTNVRSIDLSVANQ